MDEKRLETHYQLDEKTVVKIVTVRASILRDTRRWQMMNKADDDNKAEADEAIKSLRLYAYPLLVCGTESVEGLPWPMTFEQFLELDTDFVNFWNNAVYKVNPQWVPGYSTPELDQKKEPASASTSAST
jgi:hypothetical protein